MRHRARWQSRQKRVDASRLVFIDETWTKTNMTRLYGWAPRGERLIDKVPQGKGKTATFLAALRNDRIEAPCLFDGPIILPRGRSSASCGVRSTSHGRYWQVGNKYDFETLYLLADGVLASFPLYG
jgi:hypothetical protein